jgi:hypothetical protein
VFTSAHSVTSAVTLAVLHANTNASSAAPSFANSSFLAAVAAFISIP